MTDGTKVVQPSDNMFLFSCDSSSICDNVCRSDGWSVGWLVSTSFKVSSNAQRVGSTMHSGYHANYEEYNA